MNAIADQLQALLEQSWEEKERAVLDQDFRRAAAIRAWGEKLKDVIELARKIDGIQPVLAANPSIFTSKKKTRWSAILTLDGKPISDEWFLKVNERPALMFEEGRSDMSFYWLWRPADYQPEKFDGMIVRLYDGCGDMLEAWVLPDVKLVWITDEGEGFDAPNGEHIFSFGITHGIPQYTCFKTLA